MSRKDDISRVSHREAHINEYKGALFEYLVGADLAQAFPDLLEDYLESAGIDLAVRLGRYEKRIKELDSQLYSQIPVFGKASSQHIARYLLNKAITPNAIKLIGQSDEKKTHNQFGEGDLLITDKQNGHWPISLKLGKAQSFVNTKSGGIKSFLTKYFSDFPLSSGLQHNINEILEESFLQLWQSLYEIKNLPFTGNIDGQWEKSGETFLPGSFSSEMKEKVLHFYQQTLEPLFDAFQYIFCHSTPEQKIESLLPLLGVSTPNIIQLIFFYSKKSDGSYQQSKVMVHDEQFYIDQISSFKLIPPKKGVGSFELEGAKIRLQIRPKPMNVISTPALKINCSVKYK